MNIISFQDMFNVDLQPSDNSLSCKVKRCEINTFGSSPSLDITSIKVKTNFT